MYLYDQNQKDIFNALDNEKSTYTKTCARNLSTDLNLA